MGHRIAGARLIGAIVVALLTLGRPSPAAAAVTVDLDQWASSDGAWQNGNLNGNNSRYPEGGVVPFRLAIEGLKAGEHDLHINHDFTAGGHKAYDFLATWNATNASGKICSKSGGAISSMCPDLPSSSSFAFPSDPFAANGLSVRGAERYSGMPRRLTIWGGAITSISTPDHAGSPNGNSTADLVVRFRSTGAAVLLAWGGHLAQSGYWDVAGGGAADGASLVSGAPWHMRTLRLDGAGAKNQDRSIQPSAIVGALPAANAPTPRPTAPPAPAAPAAPGSPGSPGGGGSTSTAPGPGRPNLTPPPTATAAAAAGSNGGPPLVAFGLLATVSILVTAAFGATGRQRRPDSR